MSSQRLKGSITVYLFILLFGVSLIALLLCSPALAQEGVAKRTPSAQPSNPVTADETRPAQLDPSSPNRVVGYFTQWGIYDRNYHVKNIKTSGSAEKLTVINYAFGHVVNGECVMVTQTGVMDAYADYQKSYSAYDSVDGVADAWNQPLRGNFNQLKKLKAMYPQIKVLISLGGWTWSEGFSDAALTPESRRKVAESCIDIYIKGNLPEVNYAGGPGAAAGVFDGVDIDWEYPACPGHPHNIYRPEDTVNFTLLLEEFRRQLDDVDPNLLLTIAAPGGVDKYTKIELDKIHEHLDFINLMTYDFHGGWETNGPTNFHAQLYGSPNDPSLPPIDQYFGDNVVQAYLDAGIPAHKLSLGLPFYGRGWTGVTNVDNGLYQTATGPAPGKYEAGVNDYKILKPLGYPSFRDPITESFWIFNGSDFWSYDDPVSIGVKMNYIKMRNLGGAMLWSLDGDTANGELISAVHAGL